MKGTGPGPTELGARRSLDEMTCFGTCYWYPLTPPPPPGGNPQGNAGMAIAETEIDSLELVTLSFGNQGLNPDLMVESQCLSNNGTVDCSGETVQVKRRGRHASHPPFLSVHPFSFPRPLPR